MRNGPVGRSITLGKIGVFLPCGRCGILAATASILITKLFKLLALPMSDELRKRPLARRRAANGAFLSASAPAAPAEGGAAPVETVGSGSTCGHEGCSTSPSCNVRYVGPMSHVSDHHAVHAARGTGHVWAASIITGFAVVLTGVIAFQSVQAKSEQTADTDRQISSMQVTQLNARLENLEKLMQQTKAACGPSQVPAPNPSAPIPSSMLKGKPAIEPGFGSVGTASTTPDMRMGR